MSKSIFLLISLSTLVAQFAYAALLTDSEWKTYESEQNDAQSTKVQSCTDPQLATVLKRVWERKLAAERRAWSQSLTTEDLSRINKKAKLVAYGSSILGGMGVVAGTAGTLLIYMGPATAAGAATSGGLVSEILGNNVIVIHGVAASTAAQVYSDKIYQALIGPTGKFVVDRVPSLTSILSSPKLIQGVGFVGAMGFVGTTTRVSRVTYTSTKRITRFREATENEVRNLPQITLSTIASEAEAAMNQFLSEIYQAHTNLNRQFKEVMQQLERRDRWWTLGFDDKNYVEAQLTESDTKQKLYIAEAEGLTPLLAELISLCEVVKARLPDTEAKQKRNTPPSGSR